MTKKQMRGRTHSRIEEKREGRLGTQSRPLDVHRWSDYPQLRMCLGELVTELQANEKRQRARSHRGNNKFRDALRCIVLDLYVAWTADPATEVGIALGKGNFSRGARYNALFLTYDSFHPALRGLITHGYVEQLRKGFNDPRSGKGRVTRIRATPKLIAMLTGHAQLTSARIGFRTDETAAEVIILRDGRKKPISYEDTEATRLMRSDLKRINAALTSHWIDLYLPDSQMAELNARMRADHRVGDRETFAVDLSAKRLHRVFNNGDWKQGGRFYGGWWQNIPKEYRAHITINGKHIVEIDYSGMHPALLYAVAGAKLDTDVDVYDIGRPNVPRHIVKIAFNKLVYASSRTRATLDFDEQQFGMSWSQLISLIRLRHEPIAQLLGTGHGLRLQNTDARIANRIMLRFLSSDYVCLPVHDSFIVHHALKCELQKIMEDEFRAEVGTEIVAKTKFDIIKAEVGHEDDATDIANPMAGLSGKYAGHETRLNNWFNNLRN